VTAHVIRAALVTAALLALGVWVGGMFALGAIAAPVVFGTVPAPTSADAMTIVFRRFDRVAIACVLVVLAVEAALVLAPRWTGSTRITRVDVARVGAAVVAAACAFAGGLFVSPKIEALHRAGAIRGLGPAGLELESAHRLAERLGSAELALATIVIALHVVSLVRKGLRLAG
jgi:hypothetical protein